MRVRFQTTAKYTTNILLCNMLHKLPQTSEPPQFSWTEMTFVMFIFTFLLTQSKHVQHGRALLLALIL